MQTAIGIIGVLLCLGLALAVGCNVACMWVNGVWPDDPNAAGMTPEEWAASKGEEPEDWS